MAISAWSILQSSKNYSHVVSRMCTCVISRSARLCERGRRSRRFSKIEQLHSTKTRTQWNPEMLIIHPFFAFKSLHCIRERGPKMASQEPKFASHHLMSHDFMALHKLKMASHGHSIASHGLKMASHGPSMESREPKISLTDSKWRPMDVNGVRWTQHGVFGLTLRLPSWKSMNVNRSR